MSHSCFRPAPATVRPVGWRSQAGKRQQQKRLGKNLRALREKYSALLPHDSLEQYLIETLLKTIDPQTQQTAPSEAETEPFASVPDPTPVEAVRYRSEGERRGRHEAGLRQLARWWRRYGGVYQPAESNREIIGLLRQLEVLLNAAALPGKRTDQGAESDTIIDGPSREDDDGDRA